MAHYDSLIAGLFSSLEIQQLELSIKSLSISDLKLIRTKVLPKIRDIKRKNSIKGLIEQQEFRLLLLLGSQSTKHNQTVNEHLQQIYTGLNDLIAKNAAQTAALVAVPPPVISPPVPTPSLASIIWMNIRYLFSFAWFSFTSRQNTPQPTYVLTLTPEEQQKLRALQIEGAQTVNRVTGVSRVVHETEAYRSHQVIATSIESRFGMVVASQMVAATKNKAHSDLFTVGASLALPTDRDSAIEEIQHSLQTVINTKNEEYPLKGEHLCSVGGSPEFVTAFESEVVYRLLNTPGELSVQEQDQLKLYQENTQRSRDLSDMLFTVCSSWGGYKQNGEDKHKYLKSANFESEQQKYRQKLDLASKAVQKACMDLKDGQSLYLETGLEKHAMQLVIKRIGNEFKLSTYDSSGALENTYLSGRFLGLIELFMTGEDKTKTKNAYTFTVPREKLISTQGRGYLSYLIYSNSLAGWAQESINNQFQSSTMEERSHMSWLRKMLALRRQSSKYANYLQHFASLASPDAPPHFEDVLQRPQNTQNCYAKKTQSCELYELGKPIYKKLRLAMILEQKKELLKDIKDGENFFINAEYLPMLTKREPQYLSPSELHEVSMRLCELKEPPSGSYYQKYFQALLDTKAQLMKAPGNHQLTISRIDEKIASHAKAYYLYLEFNQRHDEINQVFTAGALKMESPNKIDPKALKKLSEYAAAQAWKATIQLMNHQIKKLQVKERYIERASERLSKASTAQLLKVTPQELADINIVNFIEGISRKEVTRVELKIGNKRCEIDIDTFFNLLVLHKRMLTHPKVRGLLDYLRNSSPEIEQLYQNEVYPVQLRAFKQKLKSIIKQTKHSLTQAINQLQQDQLRVSELKAPIRETIWHINQEILLEQQRHPEKSTLKIKNLELRLSLLNTELEELQVLDNSLTTKILKLQGTPPDNDSVVTKKIKHATDILTNISSNKKQSINAVSNTFHKAQRELAKVNQEMEYTLKTFKDEDIDKAIDDRLEKKAVFRKKTIRYHLQSNAEYQILHELAEGHLGTDKDRNRYMYQENDPKTFNQEQSVFYQIQKLNQQLKVQVEALIEHRIIVNSPIHDKAQLDSLQSAHNDYLLLEQQAQDFSKETLPPEIKQNWVKELFFIWLNHEDKELLYKLSDNLESINKAFHYFLEQKANLKHSALIAAGYPIVCNTMEELYHLGWKIISTEEIEQIRTTRKEKIRIILKKFQESGLKRVAPPRDKVHLAEDDSLTEKELAEPQKEREQGKEFGAPNVVFLSLESHSAEGSTVKFLREHPLPVPEGASSEHCTLYYTKIMDYLQQLKTYPGLENKAQRIHELCYIATQNMFRLSYPPTTKLILIVAHTLVSPYRDEQNSIKDSFLQLENTERVQLLSSLIKLILLQISKECKVSFSLYSTLKQWERLIIPMDGLLSQKIAALEPGSAEPCDLELVTLINEVDLALHESPVSLEGLYEGQQGLQRSLTAYGNETSVDEDLRALADHLEMRCGNALLAHQFIHYFSNKNLLFSSSGINSTQGREFFTRAFLDAFQHATASEQHDLLTFLHTLSFDEEQTPCKLMMSHEVFLSELLLRCAPLNPALIKDQATKAVDSYIVQATHKTNEKATERLIGFAKEINVLALKIELAKHQDPRDQELLDTLYARFICANLAYQLLVDQIPQEILFNLKENFECTREMAQVQAHLIHYQEDLYDYVSQLNVQTQAQKFKEIFQESVHALKFATTRIQPSVVSVSDIPGFIQLGNNKSLDVVHGAIYQGNNKLGVMPANIQSHIILHELGLDILPFKYQEGAYVYTEDKQIIASIKPMANGDLTIQRILKTLDGTFAMMQYIAPEQMEDIPKALKQRIHAEHYFLDAKGNIHGYSSDLKPILQLEFQQEHWHGLFLDHHGKPTTMDLNYEKNQNLIQELACLFPQEELIPQDENTIYIPAIAQYVIRTQKDQYLITDNRSEGSVKKHLHITERGIAKTTRVLSAAEQQELEQLEQKIKDLGRELAKITNKDLLSTQKKDKLAQQIKESKLKIKEIQAPEYWVFITNSKQIVEVEQQYKQLKEDMQQAYIAFKDEGKDRAQLALLYEQKKEAYLQNKLALHKAYASINYLRHFDVVEDKLHPKEIQSIFYIGFKTGKAKVLNQFLSLYALKTPLKSSELEDLKNLKTLFATRMPATKEDQIAFVLLMGLELQHYILEREAVVTNKLDQWDRTSYHTLMQEFSQKIKETKQLFGELPTDQFNGLWQALQAEFTLDKDLQTLFATPEIEADNGVKKPINIQAKTTNMPIETLGARTLVQFSPHHNLNSLIDKEPRELQSRLSHLDYQEVIQAQEEGYYYENYGLFNIHTLEKILHLSNQRRGIAGFSHIQLQSLFRLMQQQGWFKPVEGIEHLVQLTAHPSTFYSSAQIASFLMEQGFSTNQIKMISARLEEFFYQTAVSGGTYTIKDEGAFKELKQEIDKSLDQFNMDYLQALDKINSTLVKASTEINMADLNAAYLLNDYRSILAAFSEKDRLNVTTILNNAMTKMLFYKTEADHFKDIKTALPTEKDSEKTKTTKMAKAISMLHIRRNYSLDSLLDSAHPSKEIEATEEDRTMQRAFLLFEAEFGHRCNARQVSVFRGLLLDERTDPDKIDSAQARMGFGKTTLLPLIALYKTGKKLVRFIVPKSALETNTSDLSLTLTNILGRRAIQDDFQRYQLATDPTPQMGEQSPRLKSLRDVKADLQKRLALYQRVQKNRAVLVQAPNVRNSMECQVKIFLDLLLKLKEEPLQQQELMECIRLLNEIRSMTTVSVFDELDATQDPTTTDVNYTSGEKVALEPAEIYPLELITDIIGNTEDKSTTNLAKILLKAFAIEDENQTIYDYVRSLQSKKPITVTEKNSTEVYLIRAILTDPIMLSIFTQKEPGTDFGVWFENAKDGSRIYDYKALSQDNEEQTKTPLLIAIPYSAANTPKPQGSRFDNPEVTAITTLRYYLDSRTELHEVPHVQFLIDILRKGLDEVSFTEFSGKEFQAIFADLKRIAEIEDVLVRTEEQKKYFTQLHSNQHTVSVFRKILARTIIQTQVSFDAGRANSNRYEQGTSKDVVLGFSGTAGDTSSHFKENLLDPAADGTMTLGIMARKECQKTLSLDTSRFTRTGEDYTKDIIAQLAASFGENSNTRTLIDVGGLCKASNRAVAEEIALQLQQQGSTLEGVIFYDDVSNMKKLLTFDAHNNVKIMDLTAEKMKKSDEQGCYFTYFDQSHARGADIKQMNQAHALLTLNFAVSNNDYKQAIMRMRKIIDRSLGQSFSTAVPLNVREKIIGDLKLPNEHILTGNDIAFWLRKKELGSDLNTISLLMMELDAVIKNTILQQQAELTQCMSQTKSLMSEAQIEAFKVCVAELNKISPFITSTSSSLAEKYGKSYESVKKADFIADLRQAFARQLTDIFTKVDEARASMDLPLVAAETKKTYLEMEQGIINKREAQLSEEFIIPSTNSALAEIQAETENISNSQSMSQTQSKSQTLTNSFSSVSKEKVLVGAKLKKYELSVDALDSSYLLNQEALQQLVPAHKIPHMQHLFKEQDAVRCSPRYLLTKDKEDRVPPVHYFLAREEGDPLAILIDQDEANVFKAAPVAPWSLYDIRLKEVPISGPEILSLNDLIWKKLHFASYRYKVTGSDLATLAQSLEGIENLEELQPALAMQIYSQNAAQEETLFTLREWGFHGDKQQYIPLKIEQTKEQVKRGITLRVGEGEEQAKVFISEQLYHRILAAKQQGKQGSLLKDITAQIRMDYEQARGERIIQRSYSMQLKERKNNVIAEYDQKIAQLEARKKEAIDKTKSHTKNAFNRYMKNFLNCKTKQEELWENNLRNYCSAKWGFDDYGFEFLGQRFESLDLAITYCYATLYEEHQTEHYSEKVLNKKIGAYCNLLYQIAEQRFHEMYSYRNYTTLFEALYETTLMPKQSKQDKKKGLPATLEIESNSLENILKFELYFLRGRWMDPVETIDEKIHKTWNLLVKTIKELIINAQETHPSLEEFYQQLEVCLLDFVENNTDNKNLDIDNITDFLLPKLCFSLNSDSSHEKNKTEIQKVLRNIIKTKFLELTKYPQEGQIAFYQQMHDILKSKINPHNYTLPPLLLNYNEVPIPPEVIKTAIKEALTNQHVYAVDLKVNYLAKEVAGFLAGQNYLQQLLDNYTPVAERSSQITLENGQEAFYFNATFDKLQELDAEVLPIDKEIAEAKQQKKILLAEIEEEHAKLRKQVKTNNEQFRTLKKENKAVNKLLAGLGKLFSVFTNHQVIIEQEDPQDFLDSHFDLPQIIAHEVEATAQLTFAPPGFYEVGEDMEEQRVHLHGLIDSEKQAADSLHRAIDMVKEDAMLVKSRTCSINRGDLGLFKTVPPASTDTPNTSSASMTFD